MSDPFLADEPVVTARQPIVFPSEFMHKKMVFTARLASKRRKLTHYSKRNHEMCYAFSEIRDSRSIVLADSMVALRRKLSPRDEKVLKEARVGDFLQFQAVASRLVAGEVTLIDHILCNLKKVKLVHVAKPKAAPVKPVKQPDHLPEFIYVQCRLSDYAEEMGQDPAKLKLTNVKTTHGRRLALCDLPKRKKRKGAKRAQGKRKAKAPQIPQDSPPPACSPQCRD